MQHHGLRGVAALLAGLIAAVPVAAGALEELTGDEIAKRINARDDGTSMSRSVEMQLVDRRGSKRVRTTRSFRKYIGDDKRLAVFFRSPKTIRDTAFLTYDYGEPGKEDDQWVYLPAMRKSRRISASDRGNSFFGTDLSYEDVKNETKVAIADYRWSSTGEKEIGGSLCYVVEAIPVDDRTARELGYSKVVLYVDPEIWIMRQADYWDRSDRHLKTVEVDDIRQVQGIWTPHRIVARNHRSGHHTVFSFTETDYATELDDALFTERRIRQGLR